MFQGGLLVGHRRLVHAIKLASMTRSTIPCFGGKSTVAGEVYLDQLAEQVTKRDFPVSGPWLNPGSP
jgi:hypothetical protein